MSLRGFKPAEGGTATLHRLNEQLDDPGKKSSCLFLQKMVSKNQGAFVKPARCSRPPMEHVYAAEADDRDRSFCGNLEIFLGWLVKPSFLDFGDNSFK